MADLDQFIPLRVETMDDIRARLDADVNAGIDPEDAAFIDTTPGGEYFDVTQAIALEIERLWDFAANDVPAAMFLETAWGDYLDAHGATITEPRKEANPAAGYLVFTGDDGTLIPTGTEVSTVQTDPDADPVSFVTIESGTISGGTLTLAASQEMDPTIGGAVGNVPSGSVTLLLSGLDGISAVTNPEAMTDGTDIESDEQYRERLELENSAAQGAGSQADYQRWALANPGVGNVRVGPQWNGVNTVRLEITDVDNMPTTTALRDELQAEIDPFAASTTLNGGITLPTGTIAVHDLTGFAASGRVYINDQLVSYTGKSASTGAGNLTGCTGGTGAQSDGSAVVQSGMGDGLAPVGTMVTVGTPSVLTIDIGATIALDDGYSLDGSGGTIAVESQIDEVLDEYINGLPPGGENPPGVESPVGSGTVLLNRVRARIHSVPGVYDVSGLTLNGSGANVTVGATQIPKVGTVSLA
jgi:uncharacterized phage protein gp47/JayE